MSQANDFGEILDLLRDPSERKAFEVERLILEATEQIELLLERKGLTHADLAREAGVSPARISKALSGEANLTLKTFAELLFALGHRVERVCVRELPENVTESQYPARVLTDTFSAQEPTGVWLFNESDEDETVIREMAG